MHRQLQVIIDEFGTAQERLHQLAATVPAELWPHRADRARWSMGECVEHLNLTSRAYLPLVHAAIKQGRASSGRAPKRYRRDPVGWLLWRAVGPPVRFRVKTTTPFVPAGVRPMAELVSEFDHLQGELIDCVRQADGLPLGRLRIISPFDPRLKYTLYSCLSILPRHQHRHLWQAEQVWRRLAASGSA